MKSFFDACLYSTSTGLITDYLTSDSLTAFNSLSTIYDGIDSNDDYYNTYAVNSYTEPTSMTAYKTNIASYRSFLTSDYSSTASAHQYTTVLTNLNTLVSCASDTWVLNSAACTSGTTVWNSGNSQTYLLSGTICIP